MPVTLAERKQNSKFSTTVKVGREFNMKAFHNEMQILREQGQEVTFKSYLQDIYGDEMTPEKFYAQAGVDLGGMNVQKMLNTTDLNKYLFVEIFRDAIRTKLEYSPFYPQLITSDEGIDGPGVTMPSMDWTGVDANEVRLRDTHEGATITEGKVVTWQDKRVAVHKKARGFKQTYESIMWTPLNLAAIYFGEVGTRLAADLDAMLIDIAYNGDQADLSQSAPVIGAAVAGTLTYADIARAWMRFKRIGRNSTYMLCSEADALTITGMAEFKRTQIPNGVTPSGVNLSIQNPLPTTQTILVHDSIPTGKPMLVDVDLAFVKLTAMPLLVETERIVSRQLTGEYVSLITGFANIFRDARLVLDYTTNLTTNPGPTVYTG